MKETPIYCKHCGKPLSMRVVGFSEFTGKIQDKRYYCPALDSLLAMHFNFQSNPSIPSSVQMGESIVYSELVSKHTDIIISEDSN